MCFNGIAIALANVIYYLLPLLYTALSPPIRLAIQSIGRFY